VRPALLLCCAGLAWAQGTTPKSSAAEYEVHAATAAVEIGAEFMVHSVLSEDQSAVLKDYLVIEVALFPPKRIPLESDSGSFTLRLNGKTVPRATPQMVAAAIERPEWSPGPRRDGDVPQRPPYGNVPGQRMPIPRPPTAEERAGIDPRERVTPAQLVARTALPQGRFDGAVSGYLYFPFKGKTSAIRTLELTYDGTGLKLR
jgi:hypothetical protein